VPNTSVNKSTESMAALLAPFDKEIATVHGLMGHLYIERIWAEMTLEGLQFAVEVQETRTSAVKKSKLFKTPLDAYRDMFPLGAPAKAAPAKEGSSCPA